MRRSSSASHHGSAGGVASSIWPPGSTVITLPRGQRPAVGGGAEHLVGPQVPVGLGQVVGVPLLLDAHLHGPVRGRAVVGGQVLQHVATAQGGSRILHLAGRSLPREWTWRGPWMSPMSVRRRP